MSKAEPRSVVADVLGRAARVREVAYDYVELVTRREQSAALDERSILAGQDPDTAVLVVAPDRRLVRAPRAAPNRLYAALEDRLAGRAVLVEVGGGLVTLRIDQAAEILNRICTLDLHDDAFPSGSAARTLVAQVPATLYRLPTGALYDVIVPVTFAESVAEHLLRLATNATPHEVSTS